MEKRAPPQECHLHGSSTPRRAGCGHHSAAQNSPGQQGGEAVRRARVGADGGRGDEGCGLGPVLTPVVRAVGAEAGGDGLSVHNSACRAMEAVTANALRAPEPPFTQHTYRG